MSGAPGVVSTADLMAAALAIETAAVERYELLADQMQTHNNAELAKIFRDLAQAEAKHAAEIAEMGAGEGPRSGKSPWGSDESPEEAELGKAHYLMTPWHALQLALAAEKRALAFFQRVVGATKDAKVKELAEHFVEEEVEHVNLVNRLLLKYPKPGAAWSDDPDPPQGQE